jgi:elongation factor 2
MPRFKQIAEIQKVMGKKELIRNFGIIAHIDHGKTTLADSLLAGAGLLSKQMAGSARVLDYLEEEQKRKITIKTANISLLYKTQENSYLINLVDTPGHVDFTGKVTRALRAIDGAVVLVDAVEEIMAQTEVVTRQALEERVRPVLFINKVDRLITELQLSSEQIEEKLNHIISSFNDLIELYAEEQFKDEWKIDPARNNVAFGSALHGWGFTLNKAKQKGIKFSDIVDAYKKETHEKLQKIIPVYESIIEMAIQNLPNPKQAQAYRVDRIWGGARFSKTGKAIAECSDEEFSVMCVTNVHANPTGEILVTGRVFSGTLTKDKRLFCVNSQLETVVSRVNVQMGFFLEEMNQVSAGNIAVLTIADLLKTGETLVDAEHKIGMVPFESISYVSEPVVTVAIEPKDPKQIPMLLEALQKQAAEDPNLIVSVDQETGENLLTGMGELHLEITLNQLKSATGLRIVTSSPRVTYRESATRKGAKATARNPNKQHMFSVQVEPEIEEQTKPAISICEEEAGEILSFDEHRNVLVDCAGTTGHLDDEKLRSIIAGFEFACKAGPLCGEPMRHVKVNLIGLNFGESSENQNAGEIMHDVGKAIFGSFLTADPVLLEPVYKIIISIPTELSGECTRLMEMKRGKISMFEQRGLLAVITGRIPVSETFGLSKELRSATSGRAFYQTILDHWEQLPEKLMQNIIAEVRQRKGLALEVPDAKRFSEDLKF